MKIYYNSKIAKLFTFIDGYKTIMLFGAVFTERDSISLRTEYHEEAHCNQYHTLFYFGMFISLLTIGLCLLFGNAGWWMLWLSLIPIFLYYTWYLIEYLIRLCIYRDHDKAYHNIVFEREAFDLEKYWNKHDVLRKESEGFSFLGYYRFDHYPAPSEQQGIIYKFQINDQRYVFMFSNRYDGMRDLINNADEDVDCVTSATESSIYNNDYFYIFV